MTLPCGTLGITKPCNPAVADNAIGVRVSPTRVGVTVTDRTLLAPGEGFQLYIVTDLGEFIVDNLGQYIISG